MSTRSLRSVPAGFRHAARVVVIGASAGGIEALLTLLPSLPAGYALPVVVLMHLPEDRESILAPIFDARCAVPVEEAGDKQPMVPGTVYFAPAGYHLLLEDYGTFSLNCDAPERFSRPSIDVLLESAALAYGDSLVAILLTGANEDGAAGIAAAHREGALTVVQDPAEAQNPTMPAAAIAACAPGFVLPLAGIRSLLAQLEFSR